MKRATLMKLVVSVFLAFILVVPVGASSWTSQQNGIFSRLSNPSDIVVSIFPERPFLKVGQSLQLQPSQEVYPIWYSDDPTIASVVYNTGVVTANAPGKTTIRLYYLTASNVVIRGECTVNVVDETVVPENKYFLKYSRTQDYRLSPGTDFYSPLVNSRQTYTPVITRSSTLAGMYQMFTFTQWNVEDLGDGYYAISHGVLSTYILAIDSAMPSVNSTIVLKERPTQAQLLTDSRARWRFYAARGHYILVPECAEGTGLVLSAAGFGDGQSLKLRHFDFNSTNSYWDLFGTEYYLDNYYDESITATNTLAYLQAIAKANAFVEREFQSEFGITIRQYPLTRFHATTGDCINGNNTPCDPVLCGQCSVHHKNYSHILHMVSITSRANNHCVVKWMDRPWGAYCREVTISPGVKEHMPFQSSATLAVASNNSIVAFNTAGYQSENDLLIIAPRTLAHEVAHLFGLRDVYNDEGHDAQEGFCVMKRYLHSEAVRFQNAYNAYLNGNGPRPQFLCDSCSESLRDTIYCKLFK